MGAPPDAAEGGEHLLLERSGGFAGLTLRTRVPTEELTADQRAAVEESLSRPEPEAGRPDRFQYRLALGEREALVPEDELPAALKPLLSRLETGL